VRKTILVLLLAVVSSSASAEWVRVSVSDAGNTYVDPATILRAGDKATMSEMTDYKQIIADSEFPYRSVKRQYEFDCKRRQLRALSMASYSGHMAKGDEVVAATSPAGEWAPVGSGSVGEIMWKVACGGRGNSRT